VVDCMAFILRFDTQCVIPYQSTNLRLASSIINMGLPYFIGS
jgi:hypothetical protein